MRDVAGPKTSQARSRPVARFVLFDDDYLGSDPARPSTPNGRVR